MKTRQSKTGEYHTFRLRIPIDIWEEVQSKANTEAKSCASIVVEILRNALKKKTQPDENAAINILRAATALQGGEGLPSPVN